jgi:hypothetical protein
MLTKYEKVVLFTVIIYILTTGLGVESRLAALENAEIAKIKEICVHKEEMNDG